MHHHIVRALAARALFALVAACLVASAGLAAAQSKKKRSKTSNAVVIRKADASSLDKARGKTKTLLKRSRSTSVKMEKWASRSDKKSKKKLTAALSAQKKKMRSLSGELSTQKKILARLRRRGKKNSTALRLVGKMDTELREARKSLATAQKALDAGKTGSLRRSLQSYRTSVEKLDGLRNKLGLLEPVIKR